MKTIFVLMLCLVGCYVEPTDEWTQEIGATPGRYCLQTDSVSCSTPRCREPDCSAPQYFCCDYGEIGQPLGCYHAVDIAACRPGG